MYQAGYIKYIAVVFIACITLFGSCTCNQDKKQKLLSASKQTDTTTTVSGISKKKVSDVLTSIPSPLELSFMIKESGSQFDKSLLNKTSNLSQYNTSFQKAINLGIYGTDLGYINLYNQNEEVVDYLSTVRTLVTDLNVAHLFNFTTLKRLAQNQGKTDSLLYMTTSTFEQMNNYLKDQNRSALSVLILTGGWLEGLHLASNVALKNNHKNLMERVGEQKLTLNDVLTLVSAYQHNKKFAHLHQQLKKLKKAFKQVKIEYQKGGKKRVVKNDMVVVKDQRESIVKINRQDLQAITDTMKSIRKTLI